jgi:PEP-CTERM motif
MKAPSRFFLSGLAAAGLMAAVSPPAHAILMISADVSGTTFSVTDNGVGDLNPAVGTIQVANSSLNGVQVNGSVQFSTGTPANPGQDLLSTSSLSVVNNSGALRVFTVAVSDTDFSAPVSSFNVTGSGTWVNAAGSNIILNWFDDPENRQGAKTAFDTPGTSLGTFTSAGTDPLHSFSTDQTGVVSDSSPFSMTIWAQALLTDGAILLDRGQGEVKLASAVPEPATWAMMVLGFFGVGFMAYRRRNQKTAFRLG